MSKLIEEERNTSQSKRQRKTDRAEIDLNKPLPKPLDPGIQSPSKDDDMQPIPAAQWALRASTCMKGKAKGGAKGKGKAESGWAKGQVRLLWG